MTYRLRFKAILPPDDATPAIIIRPPASVNARVRRAQHSQVVVRHELNHLRGWEHRHKHLVARLLIAFGLTLCIDVVAAVVVWRLERHAPGTDIHGYGDAFFFSTVQLLTVSSQLKNPITAGGRLVDVLLEMWAIFVVTAVAGSFAAFFQSADRD